MYIYYTLCIYCLSLYIPTYTCTMYMYMVNLTNNIVSQHSCLVVLCCSWLPQSVNVLYQSVNSACMLGSTIILSIIIILIIIIIDNILYMYMYTGIPILCSSLYIYVPTGTHFAPLLCECRRTVYATAKF